MHPIQNLVGGELVRSLLIQASPLNLFHLVGFGLAFDFSSFLWTGSEAKAGH